MAMGMSLNESIVDSNTTRQRIASEQDFSWLNIDDDELEEILTEGIGADTPRVTSDEMATFLLELNDGESGVATPQLDQAPAAILDDDFEPIPLQVMKERDQHQYVANDLKTTTSNFGLTSPSESLFLPRPSYQNVSVPMAISGTLQKITEDPASSSEDESHHGSSYCPKFRGYQCTQWSDRYEELCEFYDKHGHSSVAHTDANSRRLARWVKRQRYQYKLKQEGKPSAMTEDRIKALERLEFVWDSHGAAWEDRLKELEEFKAVHKHCNVPSNYRANASLASWIKCQRRQYRLYREGKKCNITQARITQLETMGFQFNVSRVGGYQSHHQKRFYGNGWS